MATALRNLPQIEHPRSRQGSRDELRIRGSTSLSLDGALMKRAKTFDGLPSLREGLESRERRPSKYSQKQTNLDELRDAIANKIRSHEYAIKHQFKSHDPNGCGAVSREALQRILSELCGFVTDESFVRLLKSIGLQDQSRISFQEFSEKFNRYSIKPASCKEYISPYKKLPVDSMSCKNDTLYKIDAFSPAFAFNLLRDRATHKDFDIRAVLPQSCLETGAMILAPHLENMIARLGIRVSNFEKLWQRFDTLNIGAIRNTEFFRVLGLNEKKEPEPKTEIIELDRDETTPEIKEKREVLLTAKRKRKRIRPRLESIMDTLYYIFEEPYRDIEQGLKCFDFLSDGFISRVDFKKVFEAFGFRISAMDFDTFLSRCSIRTIRGQITYNDFLMKFWNRSESGLVNRVVTNGFHAFNQPHLPNGNVNLTAEELEAKLVDFFHGDFFRLLGTFQAYDKNRIGLITQQELRSAIQKILGYHFDDHQWNDLVHVIETESDGLVHYGKFLEKFTLSPGQWNRKTLGPIQILKVGPPATPPQVDRLRREAEAELDDCRKIQEKKEEELKDYKGRPLKKITDLISDLIRRKFHTIDKAWKNFDRKMTGRLSREDFSYMLRQCELVFSKPEIDHLWESFKFKGADGMVTFTALVRHFSSPDNEPVESTDKVPINFNIYGVLPPIDEGNTEEDGSIIERVKRFQKERRRENNKCVLDPPREINKDSNMTFSLDSMKYDIVNNWDNLKIYFKRLDKEGSTYIQRSDMIEVCNRLQFNINKGQIEQLLDRFDYDNKGRFYYLDFMKQFSQTKKEENKENVKKEKFDASNYVLKEKQLPPDSGKERFVTLSEAVERVRKQVVKEYKNVRRAFKKNDTNGSGTLTIDKFKLILNDCGIKVAGDDLYHLLCEFDENMDGKISYEEFLNRLISV